MKLLLDTHVFLWYVLGDRKLPESFKNAIQSGENEVFLSVASIWEAVVKHQLGKLPLPEAPADFLPRQREAHKVASLAIDEQTIACVANLPVIHRDPFDRIIVAQAIQHGLTVVSIDPHVEKYPVETLKPD
jgi:PIN domain nuclease of toxin-antitoxin system